MTRCSGLRRGLGGSSLPDGMERRSSVPHERSSVCTRKPTARAKANEAVRLAEQWLSREQIAKQLGIGLASVYRVLAAARA
jgi:DNA invertase Pin-like site-specific DNA recombinase